MNRKSILFQLGIYIIIAVILVFAVAVLLNYHLSREALIHLTGGEVNSSDLHLLFWKTIGIAVSGIILILLFIALIFRKLLVPLSRMTELIWKFNFSENQKKIPQNEMELLSDSLMILQKKRTDYLEEQNSNKRDWRKYERDLKSAREIQSVIVPRQLSIVPGHPEIDLYASLQPAESIGGDLYDYFFIDSNHLLFVMGDVSGKGIPAALFMAVAHTMIKNKATILSARQIVVEVNEELSRHNTNQHFLTLFLGILDIQNGILNYCNAAHNYPFLVTADRQLHVLDHIHGLPVGIYSKKTYQGDSIVLRKGDLLILYTDGVIDCKDDQDCSYGTAKLKENISNMMDLSAEELVSRLLTSLEVFRGKTPQVDDISVMAIRYLSPKN